MPFRYQIGDIPVKRLVTDLGTYFVSGSGYVSGMVTNILGGRKKALTKLHLRAWIKERCEDSVERFADRVGVHRKTAYAWINGRFPPEKYHGAIVQALDLYSFMELYRLPSRRSIDAITNDLPDEIHGDIVEIAEKMKKRAS
jgi:hypothetical protein